MAYRTNSKKRNTTSSNTKRRVSRRSASAGRMSAARRATEAAFRRGVKSGLRMRRSGSRRSYIYS
jgi:hypothetical protein